MYFTRYFQSTQLCLYMYTIYNMQFIVIVYMGYK